MQASYLTIAAWSALAIVAGCVGNAAPVGSAVGEGGKADEEVSPVGDTAEELVLLALLSDYLFPLVHDQPVELVDFELAVADDHAWIHGRVQHVDGGEVDWLDSELSETVLEGLFDGPHLEALLRVDGDGGYAVVEARVGATDIWYDELWLRYPISCRLFPGWEACLEAWEPAFGTEGRRQITEAVHEQFLDRSLGAQPNELVISWLRESDRYAFLMAEVRGAGGSEIDWSQTDYAEDVRDGFFDGPHVEAMLESTPDGWRVVSHGMASTDVWWSGIWNGLDSAPCALFDVQACD